jgi:hypothetical protein
MACRVKLLEGFLAAGERQALGERLTGDTGGHIANLMI